MCIEDPVAIADPCCPDSMTKFLLDVFSDRETSGLFYTTDMMVLLDIVTRQLTDLCPGMEVSSAQPFHSDLRTNSACNSQVPQLLLC